MKYKTKKARLQAIMNTYMRTFHVTMFTTQEVAKWAFSRGLLPVPKRGDPEEECLQWEAHLELAGKDARCLNTG